MFAAHEQWTPAPVAPLAAGGFFALGWFVFIDALVSHAVARVPTPIDASYYLPGIIATVAMLMMCMAPRSALLDDESAFVFSSSPLSCARVWLFVSFVLAFGAIGAGATLATAVRGQLHLYEADNATNTTLDVGVVEQAHVWVGDASMLQAAAIFCAGVLWIAARMRIWA